MTVYNMNINKKPRSDWHPAGAITTKRLSLIATRHPYFRLARCKMQRVIRDSFRLQA